MTTIIRNPADGTLLLNGAKAALRGGSYNLFFPRSSEKALLRQGMQEPITPSYPGMDPRQTDANRAIPATLATWAEVGNNFEEYLTACRHHRCNFVRVVLSGGTIDGFTLVPFNTVDVDGVTRYDVAGAMAGNWNDAYFTRLRLFVEQADAKGIVVQLTLFNYFDLTDDGHGWFKTWTLSPWRAENSLDPPFVPGWGKRHLVPELAEAKRQRFFISPTNQLRMVQKAFVGRVMQAVRGSANVILEVMNEPHATQNIGTVVKFDSDIAGCIDGFRRELQSRVLISINATYVGNQQPPSDVDVWKTSTHPHYDKVDLVSYHALTGFAYLTRFSAGVPPTPVNAPRVNAASVTERAHLHFGTHPRLPMMYSTDAVYIRQFDHLYNGGALGMRVRDGQIMVSPAQADLRSEVLQTRLYDWAAKCLGVARQRPGHVHFHNLSSFHAALVQIGQAASTFPIAGVAEPESAATA